MGLVVPTLRLTPMLRRLKLDLRMTPTDRRPNLESWVLNVLGLLSRETYVKYGQGSSSAGDVQNDEQDGRFFRSA